MSDLLNALERAERGASLAGPPPSLDRFMSSRDRRRRNQRLATAAFALVLAAVAIGGAIRIWERGAHLPANRPITPVNVGDVRLLATGSVGGHPIDLEVEDGLVYVVTHGSSHALVAFPATCGDHDTCERVWVADTGYADPHGGSPAGNGMVYVSTDDLYAFSATCGSGGATCEPAWVGHVDGHPFEPMLGTDAVYVVSQRRLYSFPTSCASQGGECEADWVSVELPRYINHGLTVTNDYVYVTPGYEGPGFLQANHQRVVAFPIGCGTGGATCRPVGGAPEPAGVPGFPALLSDGKVFKGREGENANRNLKPWVQAFPADCADTVATLKAPTCEPIWTTTGVSSNRFGMEVSGGGLLFVFQQMGGAGDIGGGSGGILAYPADCGTGNATCDPLWTWGTGQNGGSLVPVTGFTAVGDRLYAASGDGNLYVFGPRSRGILASASSSSKTPEIVFYLVLAAASAALIILRVRRRASRSTR